MVTTINAGVYDCLIQVKYNKNNKEAPNQRILYLRQCVFFLWDRRKILYRNNTWQPRADLRTVIKTYLITIMLYNKVLIHSKSYLQDLKLTHTVFILKLDLIIKLFLACFVFILGMSNLRVRRSEYLQAWCKGGNNARSLLITFCWSVVLCNVFPRDRNYSYYIHLWSRRLSIMLSLSDYNSCDQTASAWQNHLLLF